MHRITIGLACLAAQAASAAHAHVLIADADVRADKVQVRDLIVGEGCGGGATTSLTLHVPKAVPYLKPIGLAGWTTEIHKAAGGGQFTDVTWRGSLPGDTVGAFPVLLRAPKEAGRVVLAATQRCGDIVEEWNQLSPTGRPPAGLKSPAPYIDVGP